MKPFVTALLDLLAAPVLWIMVTASKFIKYRNMIEENWSGIDVALKQRFNLYPGRILSQQFRCPEFARQNLFPWTGDSA